MEDPVKIDPVTLMRYNELDYAQTVNSFIKAKKEWLGSINNENNPIINQTYSWIRTSINDALNKIEKNENIEINKKRLVFLIGLLIWRHLSGEQYKTKYDTQCNEINKQLKTIAAMGKPKPKFFSESLWKFKNDVKNGNTNITSNAAVTFDTAIKSIIEQLESMIVVNRKMGGYKKRHQTKRHRSKRRTRKYVR